MTFYSAYRSQHKVYRKKYPYQVGKIQNRYLKNDKGNLYKHTCLVVDRYEGEHPYPLTIEDIITNDWKIDTSTLTGIKKYYYKILNYFA